MTLSRRTLCIIYGLIAVLALIGTWGNNVSYLSLGFLGANLKFWSDTLANPASRSITVDIFFLSLAVQVWMILEARRLRMRGIWIYVVFGFLIAVSVTVPIFFINRERRLAQGEHQGTNAWGAADAAGLLLLGIAFVAYAALTLLRGNQ